MKVRVLPPEPFLTFVMEAGHIVNDYIKCPVDESHQGYEVRNWSFGDGDVHCAECGAYVRVYNAS